MGLGLLLIAALLLAVERVCYVWIARTPRSFRRWCARPPVARLGEPVAVVQALFIAFKVLQAIVFISDTHLGTPDCRAEALLAFLEAHDCDFLYLVGDIIDFWRLKRAPYWAPAHSDVLRRVVAKARAGTLVTFVPGNHDEYDRRFCDVQLGNIMIVR